MVKREVSLWAPPLDGAFPCLSAYESVANQE